MLFFLSKISDLRNSMISEWVSYGMVWRNEGKV